MRLGDVVDFIEKYKRIASKTAVHGLKLIDFMTMWVQQQLKATARKLKLIDNDILTDQLVDMSDTEIEELLLYSIAARSTTDYIRKPSTIEFPQSKSDHLITIQNFPSIYNKALIFSHRLCQAAMILGWKSDQ